MRLSLIVLLILTHLFSFNSKADSPLTSTDFHTVYSDISIIADAEKSNGMITTEMMDFILKSSTPVDQRLALINALSWNFNGKNNYDIFIEYAIKKKYKTAGKLMKKADGELMICMAYLKALDNYFSVSEAIELSKKAQNKSPKSYSVNLIAGIIQAQQEMESNWCNVYNLTNDVRENEALNIDMRVEASVLIFDYMDLYAKYCD